MPKRKLENPGLKRCIKRYSLKLNRGKWLILLELLRSFCHEKDYFLSFYNHIYKIAASEQFRTLRNTLVSSHYQSKNSLLARLWKLALKDSLETLDRYWASLKSVWENAILRNESLTEDEKKFLLKLINNRSELAKTLKDWRVPPKKNGKCINYLKRLIKRTVKKLPRVRTIRSFVAEPETYRVFEHNGRQYIALTTKEKGVRLVIPLCGKGNISGQIRIVFDFVKLRIEVHHTVDVKVKNIATGEKLGIDLGITEVFTDSDGDRWGTEFGKTLEKYSEAQKDKGKKRNKLYSIAKKNKKNRDFNKAEKIFRHNLGRKKQKKQLAKRQTRLAQEVNEALNSFLTKKDPAKVVYEDLHHLTAKCKSKKLSRKVAAWIRRIIRERLNFKVSLRGSQLTLVNCAYSSQVCPLCCWVCRGNRKGDSFKCLHCGHVAASDHAAALELLRRENDPAITLWTPKALVRLLLLQRFNRRLERENLFPTVTGKTPGTSFTTVADHSGRDSPPKGSQPESETLKVNGNPLVNQ